MKRFLIVGAVAVLGATMLASAAALGVNGGSIQAGADTTLSCDPNGVDVAYTTAWDDPNSVFKITGVTVSGIDPNCFTRTIDVVLTKTGGAQVGTTGSATITADPQAVNATAPDASLVEDVHVAIH